MIRYKLTNTDGTTSFRMEWAVGKTNRATGTGTKLCTDGYLHVYDLPEQAVLMREAHVGRSYTRLWEVECPDEGITDGTKRGVKTATVLREIPLPKLTYEQRIEIAVRLVLISCKEEQWKAWATSWLSKKDRSRASAETALTIARISQEYACYKVSCAAISFALSGRSPWKSDIISAYVCEAIDITCRDYGERAIPLLQVMHEVLKKPQVKKGGSK